MKLNRTQLRQIITETMAESGDLKHIDDDGVAHGMGLDLEGPAQDSWARQAQPWKFNTREDGTKVFDGGSDGVVLSVPHSQPKTGPKVFEIKIKTASGQTEFYYVPLYGIKKLLMGV
jgi:hypothetical protein